MIQTLCYIFCQSGFVCLLSICYIVHDKTLYYRFCQSDFVCLLSICYLVHDTDTVLYILSE